MAGSGIKEVRVYVDGTDLGTVPYGTSRPDVNNVYPGYSSGNNAGFNGTINISNIASGNKKVSVKISQTDGTIQTIERTIKVEKLASISCLEEPTSNLTVKSGQLKVSGWALAGSGIKEVRVYVDGTNSGNSSLWKIKTRCKIMYIQDTQVEIMQGLMVLLVYQI